MGSRLQALRAITNIDYRGQVAPEEAMEAIADAALLLSTSDEEGFPEYISSSMVKRHSGRELKN